MNFSIDARGINLYKGSGIGTYIENLTDYKAAGNYDLLKCEAHLSQAKQIFEILFNDEIDNTKTWQKKISELQKMPV